MISNNNDVLKYHKKIHSIYASGLSSAPEDALSKHIDLFSRISETCSVGHSFCALLDMHRFVYRHLSECQVLLTGINNDVVCERGPKILTQQLHPEDRPLVVEKAYIKAQEVLHSLPIDERLNYVHTLTYRFMHGDGTVIPLIDVVSPLELDHDGNMNLALLQVYKLSNSGDSTPVTLTVQSLEEGVYRMLHIETFKDTNQPSVLTAREKQVIGLVAKGNTSRQISHMIGISPNTINNHRSNIKKKLNLHSTAELSAYAVINNL